MSAIYKKCCCFAEMTIERVCLTAGKSVIGYLSAYDTDLYLSADESNVVEALSRGNFFTSVALGLFYLVWHY